MKRFLAVFVLLLAAAVSVRVMADWHRDQPAGMVPTDQIIRDFHSAVASGDCHQVENMLGIYPSLISAPLPDEDSSKRVEPALSQGSVPSRTIIL